MADFGLYSALRGQDDFAQKRADKQMELQILQAQQQESDRAIQQQAELEAGMNEYFQAFQEMEVLTEDRDRVNAVEETARRDVIKGLSKYNGDLKKFMMSGGNTSLMNYRKAILTSKEVQNAMRNKINLGNYMQDMSKGGMLARPVNVQYQDSEGNMQSARMTMDEQMELFKQGKIDQLNYSGVVKQTRIDPNLFFKNIKDPSNPYVSHAVTESDVYNMARTHYGLEEWHARELAKEYGDLYEETGNYWQWGSKDPYELELKKMSLLQRMASKQGGSKAGKNAKTLQDYFTNLTTGKGLGSPVRETVKPKWGYNWRETLRGEVDPNKSNVKETTYGINAFDKKMISEMMGVALDTDGTPKSGQKLNTTLIYSPADGAEVDLKNNDYRVSSIIPQVVMVGDQSYIPVELAMSETTAETVGIENTSGIDHINSSWKASSSVDGDWLGYEDRYKVKAYIKMPDSRHMADYYNKKLNIGVNTIEGQVPETGDVFEQSMSNVSNVMQNF